MCNYQNSIDEPLNTFSDEDFERIILEVYFGLISTRKLDLHTYLKIARKLSEGVFEGYGLKLAEALTHSEDYLMLKALQENVYIFSAAKTYQQTNELEYMREKVSRALASETRVNQFNEFKKQAKEILKEYNEHRLRAEYNSATSQGRTASQWQEIKSKEKDLPVLKYQTVGDARVRPEHVILDNIVKPVGDKFWDHFMPPNGWNCRCTVIQDEDEPSTDTSGLTVSPNDVPPEFRFNAGKERIVFSPKHPYFKVAPRDKDWAKQNFGLPLP